MKLVKKEERFCGLSLEASEESDLISDAREAPLNLSTEDSNTYSNNTTFEEPEDSETSPQSSSQCIPASHHSQSTHSCLMHATNCSEARTEGNSQRSNESNQESRNAAKNCAHHPCTHGPSHSKLCRHQAKYHITPHQLEEINSALPHGWQARLTSFGRVYFCNHVTRTTQWERPTLPASLDCYASHSTSSFCECVANRPALFFNAPCPVHTHSSSYPLNQRDLMMRAHYHSRRCLYPEGGSLPAGWEQRVTASGQIYYLDHNTRRSTWDDPRQNGRIILNEGNLGSLPAGWEMRTTLQGRKYFVDHNSRTTQFSDPRIFPPIPVEDASSLPKFHRDLKRKLEYIRILLRAPAGHFRLSIRREHLFEDSYRAIQSCSPLKLKQRLEVKFQGEEGIDYGGLAREWFYLISHEIFNPAYGLFQYSKGGDYVLQINPASSINPNHLSYFAFVGRLMGMAIFHGHHMDGGFILPFYKQILGRKITLKDLDMVDPQYYKSLQWILENEITENLGLVFTVNFDEYGKIKTHELKPGGSNLPVVEENKKEYVKLLVHWIFGKGIRKQFAALLKGFTDLIPRNLLEMLDERDLEMVISGLGKIDLEDWKKHTVYRNCKAEDELIVWFWDAMRSFEIEIQAKVLQFCTGTSRIPVQGFRELYGSHGLKPFTIEKVDVPATNLPKSHTCFNRLDLPPYTSYEMLKEKLRVAVTETVGFGID
eukprot:Sdes_comp19919_c0_seq1m12344